MAAADDLDTQRIEFVRDELRQRLVKTGKPSTTFTFLEIERVPLFGNRLAFAHVLDLIEEHSNKKIRFDSAHIPQQILPGGFRPPGGSSTMDAFGSVVPTTVVPPQSIGYEVFVSDPSKLDEYFSGIIRLPIRLSECKVEFDEGASTMTAGDRSSLLPAVQNEHYLCTVMFKKRRRVPVDWSVIYERMTGNDALQGRANVATGGEVKAHSKMVYDTMRAVNERVKADLNTPDDLFSWNNKSVVRNY